MALDKKFWQEEREQIFNMILPHIRSSAVNAAETALEGLVSEVGVGLDWALVNTDVQKWARKHAGQLVKGITETTQKQLQAAVSDWVESGQPLDDLMESLAPMFGKTRSEMIAITEITKAYAEGNRIAWKASEVVDKMEYMTAMDELVCPICGPLSGKRLSLDETSEIPPVHVRCRCWTQPVVKK